MDLDEANTVVAHAKQIYPRFASAIVPSGSEPDRDARYVVVLSHSDGFTMVIHTLQVWLNHIRDMVRPTVRVLAQASGQVSAEAHLRRAAQPEDQAPRTAKALHAYQEARQHTYYAETVERAMVDAWEAEMEAARVLADALIEEHVLGKLSAAYRTMLALRERERTRAGDARPGEGIEIVQIAPASGMTAGQMHDVPAEPVGSVEERLRRSITQQEEARRRAEVLAEIDQERKSQARWADRWREIQCNPADLLRDMTGFLGKARQAAE